jgi:L-ascorbate metabolism protein UlaG (beta-lactamase superfamily)
MQITWLGHSGFRIAIGDQVLLIDPWLAGNPTFPADQESDALTGATAIFVTHGHGDHFADIERIARLTGATVYAQHEIGDHLAAKGEIPAQGFLQGGTITLGSVRVTMVPASHSSSFDGDGAALGVAGSPCGFMIRGEGRCIYVSGDTGIMADMGWMGEYFAPDVGILCCGGHYTMDADMAAWAARKFFAFKTVIPCHYRTFGLLAQDVSPLARLLPGVDVRIPAVMETLTL